MGKVFIKGLVQTSGERVYCTLSALKHWDFGKKSCVSLSVRSTCQKVTLFFQIAHASTCTIVEF